MQNFENHIQKHPLFHYFLAPFSLLLIPITIVNLFLVFSIGNTLLVLLAITLHLTVFIARFYAKKNQDRIIRIEMRFRYYQLTGESFDSIEKGLSIAQIAALRFASDKELTAFINNPSLSGMTATAIKKQIIHWEPDLLRV
jgi:hypothetical protein